MTSLRQFWVAAEFDNRWNMVVYGNFVALLCGAHMLLIC